MAENRYCEACDGSGVEVFAVRVYEHGCGFAHDGSDERPCRHCNGTGMAPKKQPPLLSYRDAGIIDEPF